MRFKVHLISPAKIVEPTGDHLEYDIIPEITMEQPFNIQKAHRTVLKSNSYQDHIKTFNNCGLPGAEKIIPIQKSLADIIVEPTGDHLEYHIIPEITMEQPLNIQKAHRTVLKSNSYQDHIKTFNMCGFPGAEKIIPIQKSLADAKWTLQAMEKSETELPPQPLE